MRISILAMLAAAVVAAVPAWAHHGYSAFEREHRVSIEGVLEQIDYRNPHTILTINTKDGVYSADWQSYTSLRKRGVGSLTLKKGDHIIVTGSPSPDASAHKITMVTQLTRSSDGWIWER